MGSRSKLSRERGAGPGVSRPCTQGDWWPGLLQSARLSLPLSVPVCICQQASVCASFQKELASGQMKPYQAEGETKNSGRDRGDGTRTRRNDPHEAPAGPGAPRRGLGTALRSPAAEAINPLEKSPQPCRKQPTFSNHDTPTPPNQGQGVEKQSPWRVGPRAVATKQGTSEHSPAPGSPPAQLRAGAESPREPARGQGVAGAPGDDDTQGRKHIRGGGGAATSQRHGPARVHTPGAPVCPRALLPAGGGAKAADALLCQPPPPRPPAPRFSQPAASSRGRPRWQLHSPWFPDLGQARESHGADEHTEAMPWQGLRPRW